MYQQGSYKRSCDDHYMFTNLLGESLILEGDLSPLLVAASGQDVDDGLFVYACSI